MLAKSTLWSQNAPRCPVRDLVQVAVAEAVGRDQASGLGYALPAPFELLPKTVRRYPLVERTPGPPKYVSGPRAPSMGTVPVMEDVGMPGLPPSVPKR